MHTLSSRIGMMAKYFASTTLGDASHGIPQLRCLLKRKRLPSPIIAFPRPRLPIQIARHMKRILVSEAIYLANKTQLAMLLPLALTLLRPSNIRPNPRLPSHQVSSHTPVTITLPTMANLHRLLRLVSAQFVIHLLLHGP